MKRIPTVRILMVLMALVPMAAWATGDPAMDGCSALAELAARSHGQPDTGLLGVMAQVTEMTAAAQSEQIESLAQEGARNQWSLAQLEAAARKQALHLPVVLQGINSSASPHKDYYCRLAATPTESVVQVRAGVQSNEPKRSKTAELRAFEPRGVKPASSRTNRDATLDRSE